MFYPDPTSALTLIEKLGFGRRITITLREGFEQPQAVTNLLDQKVYDLVPDAMGGLKTLDGQVVIDLFVKENSDPYALLTALEIGQIESLNVSICDVMGKTLLIDGYDDILQMLAVVIKDASVTFEAVLGLASEIEARFSNGKDEVYLVGVGIHGAPLTYLPLLGGDISALLMDIQDKEADNG